MNIQIIEDISIEKWEYFVLNHPHSNPFQMPWMYSFYEKVKSYEPLKLFVVDSESHLKGCLIAVIIKEGSGIKGRLSSRAIISGGPLIDCNVFNHSEILRSLIDELIKKVTKLSIYIEFRNFFQFDENSAKLFIERGFYFEENINYIIDLKKTQSPFDYLSESKRRQIKRAIKEGSAIVIAQTLDEVNEFYSLLVDLYKYRAKKPLADLSFFYEFFSNFCSIDNGLYLLVKKDNKTIGGIMCIIHKDVIYEWYVCGLDREFKYNYPSVMATWSAIEYGYYNGLNFFDFLGAGNPNEKYGVRDFKSKFGGDTYNYGRFIRINYPYIYKFGKLLVKIYSRFL